MSKLRIKDAPLLDKLIGDEKIPTGGRGDFATNPKQIVKYVEDNSKLVDNSDLANLENKMVARVLEHEDDTKNPHSVTKEQVGLGNVNNTRDLDKPTSNPTLNLLNEKADISYVDKSVASVAGGLSGSYKTYDEAVADKEAWNPNTSIQVTNDSDSKKNGLYTWDGEILTKSDYDPLQMSESYTDNEVGSLKSDFNENIGKINHKISFKKSCVMDFYIKPNQINSIKIDDAYGIFPFTIKQEISNILDFFTPKTIGISAILVNEKGQIFSKSPSVGVLDYDFFIPKTVGVSVLTVNEKGQILSSGSGGGDSSLRVDLNGILTSQQGTKNSPRFFRNGEQIKQQQNEYPDYYYQSYEELDCTSEGMYQKFDAIMSDFPDIMSRREIGRSVQDRPIYEYSITPKAYRKNKDNPVDDKFIKPVTIAIYACTHGNEYAGTVGLYVWVENLLRRWQELDGYGENRFSCEFKIVPCVNPDGMKIKQRVNANGVDLNRNFDSEWVQSGNSGSSAASEPETQVMQAWFAETNAAFFIDLHEHGENELFWLGGYTDASFGILGMVASKGVRFAFQNLDLAKYANPEKTSMLYVTKSPASTAVNYLGNVLEKDAMLIESPFPTHAMTRSSMLLIRELTSRLISKTISSVVGKTQNARMTGNFTH